MEAIPTDIFDLLFVEDKVTHGGDTILSGFMKGIPDTEFSTVGACSNLPVVFVIPLHGKTLSLMSFEGQVRFKLRLSFDVFLLVND